MQINVGTLHLDNDYVLCETGTLKFGVDWNNNFDGNVNLEGHVQKVGRMICGWTPSAKPTRVGSVLGASGTLEVVGSTGSNLSLNFQGGTSYRHSGSCTNVFWNAVSTSTGRLEVVNGGVVLRDGAGWRAVRNLTISGNGYMKVFSNSASVAFGASEGVSVATMEFPDGTGSLEIEGGTATVKKLKIGSQWIKPGVYGGGALPVLSGEGSLRVLRYGSPGAIVVFW